MQSNTGMNNTFHLHSSFDGALEGPIIYNASYHNVVVLLRVISKYSSVTRRVVLPGSLAARLQDPNKFPCMAIWQLAGQPVIAASFWRASRNCYMSHFDYSFIGHYSHCPAYSYLTPHEQVLPAWPAFCAFEPVERNGRGGGMLFNAMAAKHAVCHTHDAVLRWHCAVTAPFAAASSGPGVHPAVCCCASRS